MFQLFQKYYQVGNEIINAALIYTERLLEMNSGRLIFTESNAKGFLLAGLILAAKFFLDKFESQTMFHLMLGEVQHGLTPKQR